MKVSKPLLITVASLAAIAFVLIGYQAISKRSHKNAAQVTQTGSSDFPKYFMYKCAQGKSFDVRMNVAGNKVQLIETNKTPLVLEHTMSGSGIRYANQNEQTIFWAKGETAFVDVNGARTYDNCYTPGEGQTAIANPASANCINLGGSLTVKDAKNGQYGVCTFLDNRQCEEWALMRGTCPVGGLKVTGYLSDAEVYCAITGGTVQNPGSRIPMCKRTDGTICTAQANFDGECPDPNNPNPDAGNKEAP